jgi:hypothetical protein
LKKVSTRDISTKGFAPHGAMELVVLDRLNVIEAIGPFNLELVKAGDVAQEKLDAELQAKGRWATLLIFRQSALVSFEALAEIENILKRRKQKGICPAAVALVLGPEVEAAMMMSAHYLKAYTNAGIHAKLFEDRALAQEWLLKEIGPQ